MTARKVSTSPSVSLATTARDSKEKGVAKGSTTTPKPRRAAKKVASKQSKKSTAASNAESVPKTVAKSKPRASTLSQVNKRRASTTTQSATKPALLSGGNPQIQKGDGDAPVQAYIAAMPDWKSALGRRLDALVAEAVPGVRKAVKWNSPFYGVEGQGWFLSFHCFNKYVKVAFLRGGSLSPLPPGESKHKETRYLDLYEGDELDEKQLVTWLQQSAAMPGWDGGSPRLNGGIAL